VSRIKTKKVIHDQVLLKFASPMTTRRSLPFVLAPLFLRGQGPSPDVKWSRFLEWLTTQTQLSGTQGIMAAYKQKLVMDGMSVADADALVASFQARAQIDPDFQRATFNRIYSRTDDKASRTVQPNAFLAETVADLRPGRALDIGMGLGRNTIFLAQKGWNATGIDLSNVGVNKALDRARSLGVHITAVVADVNQFDLGANQWDLVCLLYFVISASMPNIRQRIATALKPGGLVVAEGFGLPVIDTLLAERAQWEPVKLKLIRMEYRQGSSSDWGTNEVGRLLFQKPA
jgi:SAM-dependent methyltransferase